MKMNKYYYVKKEEIDSFINYVKKFYPDYKFNYNVKYLVETIKKETRYTYIFEFRDSSIEGYYREKCIFNNIKLISYTNILRKEKINKIL